MSHLYLVTGIYLWLVATNCINCWKNVTNNNNFRSFVATDQIEAEDFTSASKYYIYDDCTNTTLYYVGSLTTTSVLQYDQVDFGSSGLNQITMHFSNTYSASALNISLHLGNSTNPPIVTFPVSYSGSDRCDFTTVTFSLLGYRNEIQNLFFTFPSNEGGNINLDWFSFNKTKDQFNATDKMEAEDYTSADNAVKYSCSDPTISYVGSLDPHSVLEYAGVDFETVGVYMLNLHYYNIFSGPALNISWHLDSATNPPFLNLSLPYRYYNTPCYFYTYAAYLDAPVSGVHDLFLTFPSSEGSGINIDYFYFNETKDYNASETIEAEDYSYVYNRYKVINDCVDIVSVGYFDTHSILEYTNVDFGSGVDTFVVHINNDFTNPPPTMLLHLGDYTDPPFLNISVGDTQQDYCDYVTLEVEITDVLPPSGTQNLYFTFPSNDLGTINMDWFYFKRTGSSFVATEGIQAEDYSWGESVALYNDCTDPSIRYMESQSTSSELQYHNVQFGDGVQMVTVRVANGYSTKTLHISLRLDSANSTPIAIIPIGYTGSAMCNFHTLNAFLETIVSGVHHLFLTFGLASTGPVDIDWFVFNKTTTKLH